MVQEWELNTEKVQKNLYSWSRNMKTYKDSVGIIYFESGFPNRKLGILLNLLLVAIPNLKWYLNYTHYLNISDKP